jgi:hypothetical protein
MSPEKDCRVEMQYGHGLTRAQALNIPRKQIEVGLDRPPHEVFCGLVCSDRDISVLIRNHIMSKFIVDDPKVIGLCGSPRPGHEATRVSILSVAMLQHSSVGANLHDFDDYWHQLRGAVEAYHLPYFISDCLDFV